MPISFNENHERSDLRLHPIVGPTLGHLSMLPMGAEGALIDFHYEQTGNPAVEAFVVTQQFIDHQNANLKDHSPDAPTGHTILLYILPCEPKGPF